jgi:hypothetical protein
VFSAKGAGSCKPGATPQGKVAPQTSAEGAILHAKDDVNDDFTERLRHGANDGPKGNESRFQRWHLPFTASWGAAPGCYERCAFGAKQILKGGGKGERSGYIVGSSRIPDLNPLPSNGQQAEILRVKLPPH